MNVTVFEEGVHKGALEAYISSVLSSVELKFGRETPEITARVKALATPEAAHQALIALWRVSTPEEFVQELSRL